MTIRILQLVEGAREARGLTVIIDVFRAFSVACYAFGNGARRVIPVGDLERAYELKQQDETRLLIGERGGQKLPGFDFGNSPTDIENVDFSGKTLVQTTSAGTQGIAAATGADEILAGSFCNAGALVRHIRARNPREVSLVCMGRAALEPSDEDTLCAQFLRDELEGKPTDFAAIKAHLAKYHTAQRFFDPEKHWAPARDFELCLALNRFDFVLKLSRGEDDLRGLERVTVE